LAGRTSKLTGACLPALGVEHPNNAKRPIADNSSVKFLPGISFIGVVPNGEVSDWGGSRRSDLQMRADRRDSFH